MAREWLLLMLPLLQSFPTLGMLLSAERDLRIMDHGDLALNHHRDLDCFPPSLHPMGRDL